MSSPLSPAPSPDNPTSDSASHSSTPTSTPAPPRHVFSTSKVVYGFYLCCVAQLCVFGMYNMSSYLASTIHGNKAVTAMSLVYGTCCVLSFFCPAMLAYVGGRATVLMFLSSICYLLFSVANLYARIYTLCIGGVIAGLTAPMWMSNAVNVSKLSLYCAERELLSTIQQGHLCDQLSDQIDPPRHPLRSVTDATSADQMDWYLSTIIDKNNRLIMSKLTNQQLEAFKTLSSSQIGSFTSISWLFMQLSSIFGALIAFGTLHAEMGNDKIGVYGSDSNSVRLMYGVLTFVCGVGVVCYFFAMRLIPERAYYVTNSMSKWDIHLLNRMREFRPGWEEESKLGESCIGSLLYEVEKEQFEKHHPNLHFPGPDEACTDPNCSQSGNNGHNGQGNLAKGSVGLLQLQTGPVLVAQQETGSPQLSHSGNQSDQSVHSNVQLNQHQASSAPNSAATSPNNHTHHDNHNHHHIHINYLSSPATSPHPDNPTLPASSPNPNNPNNPNNSLKSPKSPKSPLSLNSPLSPGSPLPDPCAACESYCGNQCQLQNPHNPFSPLFLLSRSSFPGPAANDRRDDHDELSSPPLWDIIKLTLWVTWRTFKEPAILLLIPIFLTAYAPFSFTVSAFSSKGGVKGIIGVQYVPLYISIVAGSDLVGAFALKRFLKSATVARISGICGLCLQLIGLIIMHEFTSKDWHSKADAWKFISIIGCLVGLGDALSVSGISTLISCMTCDRSDLLAAGSSLLMTGRSLGLCAMFALTAKTTKENFFTAFWPVVVGLVSLSILCHIFSFIFRLPVNINRVFKIGDDADAVEADVEKGNVPRPSQIEMGVDVSVGGDIELSAVGRASNAGDGVESGSGKALVDENQHDFMSHHKTRHKHRHHHHHHHYMNHMSNIYNLQALQHVHQ